MHKFLRTRSYFSRMPTIRLVDSTGYIMNKLERGEGWPCGVRSMLHKCEWVLPIWSGNDASAGGPWVVRKVGPILGIYMGTQYRQTGLKTLPLRNFVCGLNKSNEIRSLMLFRLPSKRHSRRFLFIGTNEIFCSLLRQWINKKRERE